MTLTPMQTLLVRTAVSIVLVLALGYASLCVGYYWAMRQTPERFGQIMARTPVPIMAVLPFETMWMRARAGVLKPGDQAPDFQLPTLDGRQSVALASFRGTRPVVLVFGSYT